MDMKHIIRKRAVSLVLAFMMAIGCTFSSVAEFPAAADSGHMDSNAQKISADDIVKDTGPMLMGAASSSSPLGAAQGYNLVCFGDFNMHGSDVKGYAMIGGDVTLMSGFAFGSVADKTKSHIIGGEFNQYGDGTNIIGNVKFANDSEILGTSVAQMLKWREKNTQPTIEYWDDDGHIVSFNGNSYVFRNRYDYRSITVNEPFNKNNFSYSKDDYQNTYFKNLKKELSDKSHAISQYAVKYGGNIDAGTFKAAASEGLNVYNISSEALSGMNTVNIRVDDAVKEKSYYIINVTGTDTVTLPAVRMNGSTITEEQCRHVLWNLYGADTVQNTAGYCISGSVLAPGATLSPSGSGEGGNNNYAGTMIVNEVDSLCMNFEGHNYPYCGPLPTEPQTQLTSQKSAEVKDSDKRTYNIELKCRAEGTVKPAEPVDVVLVLDKSGSMTWLLNEPETKIEDAQAGDLLRRNTDDKPDSYNYTYYIKEGGAYRPVGYVTPSLINKSYFIPTSSKEEHGEFQSGGQGWYTIEANRTAKGKRPNHKIDFSDDVTIYIKGSGDQTKYEALLKATKAFTDNFKSYNSNPASHIAAVGFSNEEGENAPASTFRSAVEAGEVQRFISGLKISGGTHTSVGLKTAQKLLDNHSDENKKYVILFSDGAADGGYSAGNAADAIKTGGAEMYCVGLFGDNSSLDEKMKDLATDEDHYFNPGTSPDGLISVFAAIFGKIADTVIANITDYIDPRFIVVDDEDSPVPLGGDVFGGTLKEDSDGRYVEWSGQSIAITGGSAFSWSKEFTIMAKAEFIGGNNIATNIGDISGVTYGDDEKFKPFPQDPTVNVKPRFYLGNTENTIFLGEAVPPVTLEPYTLDKDGHQVTGNAMYCGLDPTGAFSYQWSDAGGTGIAGATDKVFPSSPKQYPGDNTHYTLTAWFTPNGSGTKTPNTVVSEEHREGKYIVNVRSGSLTVTKTITNVPSTVNEKGRSFVFLVTGTAAENCKAITPFYVTLTMNGSGTRANKTITGLSKGTYTITEVNSNWQYDRGPVQWVDSKSALGYHQDAVTKEFSDISIAATCTNNYAHSQWFSATDSVANLFNREELK